MTDTELLQAIKDIIKPINDRLDNIECRMEQSEIKLSNIECRMEQSEIKLSNIECRMEQSEIKLSNIECQMEQSEINLSNNIKQTEKIVLDEIERVHEIFANKYYELKINA